MQYPLDYLEVWFVLHATNARCASRLFSKRNLPFAVLLPRACHLLVFRLGGGRVVEWLQDRLALFVQAGKQLDALFGLAQLGVALLEKANALLVVSEAFLQPGASLFQLADDLL